ncbi:MAG: FAD-binding oxidoreductase, partial [Rhodomicrobium sp.]|nr:FAD-binding oxidoreductase [Rhodomicrobium sp.]
MDAVAPRNGSDDYVDSYYAASANPAPLRPRLLGEETADICVIGGGYTGLSASIALLEKGYQVTLVEAERIGWGASGRNGGQIVNGLNAGLDKFERQYGKDVAAFAGSILQEGAKLIRERVAKYRISCELKDRNLFTAFTAKQIKELEDKQTLWRRFGMDDHELLDRDGVRRHVNTDAYAGGMIDHSGGQ